MPTFLPSPPARFPRYISGDRIVNPRNPSHSLGLAKTPTSSGTPTGSSSITVSIPGTTFWQKVCPPWTERLNFRRAELPEHRVEVNAGKPHITLDEGAHPASTLSPWIHAAAKIHELKTCGMFFSFRVSERRRCRLLASAPSAIRPTN